MDPRGFLDVGLGQQHEQSTAHWGPDAVEYPPCETVGHRRYQYEADYKVRSKLQLEQILRGESEDLVEVGVEGAPCRVWSRRERAQKVYALIPEVHVGIGQAGIEYERTVGYQPEEREPGMGDDLLHVTARVRLARIVGKASHGVQHCGQAPVRACSRVSRARALARITPRSKSLSLSEPMGLSQMVQG